MICNLLFLIISLYQWRIAQWILRRCSESIRVSITAAIAIVVVVVVIPAILAAITVRIWLASKRI